MSCILCQSDHAPVFFPPGTAQKKAILKCGDCGLLYLADPQGESVLDELSRKNGRCGVSRLYIQKQTLQLKDYASMERFIEERGSEPADILEVGCNVGALLDHLRKKGHRVKGVEPNQWCVEAARDTFGLEDIFPGTLSEAEYPSASFDYIIMLHVIEHLPDPNVELAEIHRLLRPGGAVVIETPTYDSWTFKLLRTHERSVRVPSHLFFFTKDTLCRLVENNGFRVAKHEYVGRTLTLERVIYNFGLMTGYKRVEKALRKALVSPKIRDLSFTVNLRDMQRVYAVKE